jgi:hypothetical protein
MTRAVVQAAFQALPRWAEPAEAPTQSRSENPERI